MRKLGVGIVLGFLAALIMGQAQYPAVGVLISNSPREATNLDSGCPTRWDKAARELKCATGDQLAGRLIQVTLNTGTLTTVNNSAVGATSRVRCGCQAGAATGATPSCNNPGAWLARMYVRSVTAGRFEIVHGYA